MRIRSFSLAKASVVSLMLLLGLGVALQADAQIGPLGPSAPKEITTNDSTLPLVYNVENSGATSVTPTFPSFADLPIVRTLPDPFVSLSTGVRDTSFAAWEQHRNEILTAFQNYMVGPKPDCHDCTITASYAGSGTNRYALTVTVTRGSATVKLTTTVVLPGGNTVLTPPANGWPYIIGIDGATGSLPASLFTNTVATMQFTSSQVTTSDSPKATDAFYSMYPNLCSYSACTGANNGNSGQFAAWAWGISRLIDGINIVATQATNPLPLNTTRSALTGCSYAGKMALWGGAMDERIALTIAQENGGGGVGSWRFSHDVEGAGAVEDADTTDTHWFATALLLTPFAQSNVYKLPIDLHEAAAMVAPRALLQTGNTSYYWLSNGSDYASSRAVQQIYNTLGIGDRFGFIVDGGHNHCAVPTAQVPLMQAYVNKFLLGQNVSTDVEVYPNGPGQPTTLPSTGSTPSYPYLFPTMDYQRWISGWGTGNQQFTNSWNSGGTVDLWASNTLTIHTGDTIQAGYAIQMAATNHPAATVQVNTANIQTDVACSDGSSYTITIPLTAQSYPIAASDKTWYPSADQNNGATYQGSVVNPGCANGAPGTTSRIYFTALGAHSTSNGNPTGPGFITSDTTQSPLVVRFHATDTNTGGGAWSAPVTINQLPLNYRK